LEQTKRGGRQAAPAARASEQSLFWLEREARDGGRRRKEEAGEGKRTLTRTVLSRAPSEAFSREYFN
jgi:hypothetical protein